MTPELKSALSTLRRLHAHAEELKSVTSMPKPYTLYYPIKNSDRPGWSYHITQLGIEELDKLSQAFSVVEDHLRQERQVLEEISHDPDTVERKAAKLYETKMLKHHEAYHGFEPWIELEDDVKEFWRKQVMAEESP